MSVEYMIRSRQARALDPSQRLLLKPESLRIMDQDYAICQVIGSTGKIYDVTLLAETTACTCPDYCNHDITCKHIYFVLSQVLRLPERIWKRGTDFSEEEIKAIHVAVDKALKQRWDEEVKVLGKEKEIQPRTDQTECPICLCDLAPKEETMYCKNKCGYVFDLVCIKRCKSNICPMCRTPF